MTERARKKIAEQKRRGRNDAIVLTIYEDQKELIWPHLYFDDGYGSLGFDWLSQEEEQERLHNLGFDALRGTAAELRNELGKEFELELRHRTGGESTRNSNLRLCNIWDLIAHW